MVINLIAKAKLNSGTVNLYNLNLPSIRLPKYSTGITRG
jgi:hypothetical protein